MAEKVTHNKGTRPFILSIFCIALLVYSGTLSIIFLMASVFNSWISQTVSDFFPERDIDPMHILVISLVSFLLNAVSFYAVYSIWNLKRSGLYIFAVAALLFLLIPVFLGFGNYYSLVIIGGLILLLFLFYRRLK